MYQKIRIILMNVLIIVCLFSIDLYPINKSKIVFESSISKSNSIDFDLSSSLEEYDSVCITTTLNYDKFHYGNRPDETATDAEIEAYRTKLRQAGKMYHSNRNIAIFKNMGITDYENKYVSVYTPTIEFKYDKETFINKKDDILSKCSTNSNISKVYVKGVESIKNSLSDAIEESNGTEYLATNQYRGSGIKVGILETNTIDVNHSNMANITKTVYDNPWKIDTSDDHATAMASIIAYPDGGIAPGVSIYSAAVMFGLSDEMDWFIENGVNVINMSFGDANPDGEYSDWSAVCDYVSYTYYITMVAGGGNDGQGTGYILNPGLGYNVLTVGWYAGEGNMSSNSSYDEVVGPEKPNLVTRGGAIIVPNMGNHNGSSISCAVMTGFVACLMSQYSDLKLYPEKVIALAMANSHQLSIYESNKSNGLNGTTGAGLFDLAQAANKFSMLQTYTNTSTTYQASTVINTFNVYLTVGRVVNFSLVWLAKATGEADETEYTSYRMVLYNGVNQQVATVDCGKSNYMMIQNYEVLTSGTYKVKIYQTSARPGSANEYVVLGVGY